MPRRIRSSREGAPESADSRTGAVRLVEAPTRAARTPAWPKRRGRAAVTAPDGDGPQRACAYCGEAHRYRWTIPGGTPPEVVDLAVATGTLPYRLVRHPRTGEPARDAHGALVFIPVPDPNTSW